MNNKDDENHKEEEGEEFPSHSQQTVSDDDEIDYSVKPEFYDPELDDKDEVWVQKKRGGRTSDAILNCPACFTTLCLDCQSGWDNISAIQNPRNLDNAGMKRTLRSTEQFLWSIARPRVNKWWHSLEANERGVRKDVDLLRLKRVLIWARHIKMCAVQFVQQMLESSTKKRSIISLTLFLASLDMFLLKMALSSQDIVC